jgi:hypothetical protein
MVIKKKKVITKIKINLGFELGNHLYSAYVVTL